MEDKLTGNVQVGGVPIISRWHKSFSHSSVWIDFEVPLPILLRY